MIYSLVGYAQDHVVQFQNIFSRYDTVATIYDIQTISGNHITAYSDHGIQYFILDYNTTTYGTAFIRAYCVVTPESYLMYKSTFGEYYVLHEIEDKRIYFALKQRIDNLR